MQHYIDMHYWEQYKSETDKESSFWKSYDMRYNMSKFKANQAFADFDCEELTKNEAIDDDPDCWRGKNTINR